METLDDLLKRFWSKVERRGPDDCWEWKRSRDKHGYGEFGLNGKVKKAHRVAYEFANGPAKLNVLHSCDNPPCCNPSHLFDGTQKDNALDRQRKGRGPQQRHPEVYRGEHNQASKLKLAQVLEIRRAHAAGEATETALAVRFGVSQVLISQIVLRKAWKTF